MTSIEGIIDDVYGPYYASKIRRKAASG